jgi:hypothetical protein
VAVVAVLHLVVHLMETAAVQAAVALHGTIPVLAQAVLLLQVKVMQVHLLAVKAHNELLVAAVEQVLLELIHQLAALVQPAALEVMLILYGLQQPQQELQVITPAAVAA